MPLGNSDGASVSSVDQASAWDSVFAEGRAVGDTASLDGAADLDGGTPQGTSDGLSDGAGSGSPVAPDPAPTGDDGATPMAGDRSSQDAGASVGPTDAPATPSETDPLAGAEPFTYAVGDETRTMDGVYRLPGDGLYVPEDKVPQFQLIASRAETLDRQNRELYDKSQSLERLTAWQRTRQGPDGKPITETLTGQQGLEAQRVAMAMFAAKANALDTLLADPAALTELLAENRDEAGNFTGYVFHPTGLKLFKAELKNAMAEATGNARERLKTLGIAPPPPEPSVAERAMPSITALIEAHKIEGLTADDVKYLVAQFEPYVTTVNGQRAIDPRFLDVMKDRASLRAEQKKLTASGKQIDGFNGGMSKGRQPAPAPRMARPVAPIPTGRNAPKARTEPSPNDMWATLIDEARTASV